MPNDDLEVVVLADRDGNLYALPRQTLDRARVPDEHRDEMAEMAGFDVSGLSFTSLQPPAAGPAPGVVTIGSFTIPSQSSLAPRVIQGQWNVA